jgi:hypothetical protein
MPGADEDYYADWITASRRILKPFAQHSIRTFPASPPMRL